jgi:hypothetical protein
MRMHLGTHNLAYLRLLTDKTIRDIERLIPDDGGPVHAEINWEEDVKFAEWWLRVDQEGRVMQPIRACYCDEVRNVIVICEDGRFVYEILQSK